MLDSQRRDARVGVIAQHGVRLPRAGLTIRKDGGIEARKSAFDDGRRERFVDLLVGGVRLEERVVDEGVDVARVCGVGYGVGVEVPGVV